MSQYRPKKYSIRVAIFLCLYFPNALNCSCLDVTFFDVGQGNGTLVTCNPHPPLLVDCGSSAYKYRGTSFKTEQISRIVTALQKSSSSTFLLIISHPDDDHYNWARELLESAAANGKTVERAWLGGEENQYKKGAVITALKGNLGDSYASKVSFPTSAGSTSTPISLVNTSELSYSILPALPCVDKVKDSNAASLVVEVKYCGKVILLPGDATAKTFKHIGDRLPKQVFIMLASHHGAEPSESSSDSCNAQSLIDHTKPSIVIFSAGKRDDYLHPRISTIHAYAIAQGTAGDSAEWHPIFCGMPLPDSPTQKNSSLMSFLNNYGALLMNNHIYSTLSQGTIRCTLVRQSNGSAELELLDVDFPAFYKDKKKGALLFPLFENESAFGPGEVLAIRLEGLQIDDAKEDDATALGELLKIASLKCPQLKTLLLTNNALSTTQIFTALVTLLKGVDVRQLTLDGPHIELDATMRKSIIDAWNMRGLELPAE